MSDEGASSEEGGEYEAYAKQPMLFLTTDQGTSAPTRTEERGK